MAVNIIRVLLKSSIKPFTKIDSEEKYKLTEILIKDKLLSDRDVETAKNQLVEYRRSHVMENENISDIKEKKKNIADRIKNIEI